MTSTQDQLDALTAKIDITNAAIDTAWLMLGGILVFLMQAGFAILEAGSVRQKNVKNILFKNMVDPCVAGIGFYVIGYAFAYGVQEEEPTEDDLEFLKFIGNSGFALSKRTDYAAFFFQWAFAATAATIVSGAMAERVQLGAYLGYCIFLTCFVYPVVVHWVWDTNGWLCNWRENTGTPIEGVGMIDFAGSGVVHLTGGLTAMWGAWIIGPRIGRFINGNPQPMPGHNSLLVVFGTIILWFGWYGFNGASTLALSDGSADIAGRVMVTTTMGASGGCLSTIAIHYFLTGEWSPEKAANGILGGLVSITASCAVAEPSGAIVIGVIGGIVYSAASKFMLFLLIDDVVDAFAVHGACGIWGCLSNGWFAKAEFVGKGQELQGILYGGNGWILGVEIAGILSICVWVTCLMVPFFLILKFFNLLRVPESEELEGLDTSHHGGTAFAKDVSGVASVAAGSVELAPRGGATSTQNMGHIDVAVLSE